MRRGGTVSGNLLIPLLPGRIGPKRFRQVVDALMRSGNAFFIEKDGKVILMAENIRENASALTRFKRAERARTGAKQIKRGQEIPIAVLVKSVVTQAAPQPHGCRAACRAGPGACNPDSTHENLMTTNRAQLLITAVDETRGAFTSIKRNLGSLGDAARSLNGLLANLGVAVSAAGLGAMVKSSLDSADALAKLSQRVGITVESLSTLIPAADLSGVSAEKFEAGLRKLATRMLEAATGIEEAKRSFAALGIAVQNQDGTLRATDAVLLDLADRFKALPDGAEKTALAVEVFGKSGADLIPFLNAGARGHPGAHRGAARTSASSSAATPPPRPKSSTMR